MKAEGSKKVDPEMRKLLDELSETVGQLLCADRLLYDPPLLDELGPEEHMWRALVSYSVRTRAHAIRRLLKSRASQ